jgi:hypothetical protein
MLDPELAEDALKHIHVLIRSAQHGHRSRSKVYGSRSRSATGTAPRGANR